MAASVRLQKWQVAPADIYLLLLAEGFLFTFGRSAFGPYASPVMLYLCSITACIGLYLFTRHKSWPTVQPNAAPDVWAQRWVLAAAVGLGLWLCVPQYRDILRTRVPQDYSDIIMAITVYAQRMLAGEVVYRPLTAELGYFSLPTYLPATWAPYILPEALHFDYRWVSGGIFVLGLLVYLGVVYRQHYPTRRTFALSVLPFGLTFAVLATEPGLAGWTVELMIVGYYLVLVACILQPSYWGQALMITICLLSRFSFVFWVPLHLGLVFFSTRGG